MHVEEIMGLVWREIKFFLENFSSENEQRAKEPPNIDDAKEKKIFTASCARLACWYIRHHMSRFRFLDSKYNFKDS